MRQHSQQNLRHVPWDSGKRYVSMITLSLSTRRPPFLLWAAWLSVPGAEKATGMLSAMQKADHPPSHREILSNTMHLQVSRYGHYYWRENFP